MLNIKGYFVLMVAVVCLTVHIEALSSKRVVLKLGNADVQPIEEKRNNIETSKDRLNNEENSVVFGINSKSKGVMENVYFKIFQTHMDRLFKQYENEILLKKLNKATALKIMNKKTSNIIQKKENNEDSRLSNNESSETRFKINKLDKKTEVNDKIYPNSNREHLNGKLFKIFEKYNNDYKEMKHGQSYDDYVENNEWSSNDFLDREEDNFMTEEETDSESQDSDNEVEEGEENEESFERIDEDRKDKEFGAIDYLVASKESNENNINPIDNAKFKYDDDFIPDDYFDNSDYEA